MSDIFFCKTSLKKRIKFQTFLQAWGKQPSKTTKSKTTEQNKDTLLLNKAPAGNLEPKEVEIVKPPILEKTVVHDLSPKKEMVMREKLSNTTTTHDFLTTNQGPPTHIESSPKFISIEVHQQIIKWICLLYILNIFLLFLFFVIIYIYK